MPLGRKKSEQATLRPSEADNVVRWNADCGGRGHVESFFLKWNLSPDSNIQEDSDAGPRFVAFWLKFTILHNSDHRSAPVGEVWAIAFDDKNQAHVAEKSTFEQCDWEMEENIFFLRFGPSEIRQGHTKGKLEGKNGKISWEVHWKPRTFGVKQLPYEWMYSGGFPRNKMSTPPPDARMNGWIEISGKRIEFEDAPGMQGHNWGVKHPNSWLWAHANIFKGKGRAVFEAVTGCIAIGPVVLPKATIVYLEYDGEPILINGMIQMFRTQSLQDGFSWTLKAENELYRIEAIIEAPESDFVGVNYRNPDGTIMRCLNSKMSSIRLSFFRRDGGEVTLVDELIGDRNAAFEIGKTGDSMGIPIKIP